MYKEAIFSNFEFSYKYREQCLWIVTAGTSNRMFKKFKGIWQYISFLLIRKDI